MRIGLLLLLVVAMQAAESARSEKFAATFAPADLGQARLAPDGRHIVYWFREGTEIFVGVLDVDAATVTMRQLIGLEREASFASNLPGTLNRVTNLRWVSSRRLVIETNSRGIVAVDADGRNSTWLANPNTDPWRFTRPPVSPPVSDPSTSLPYAFPSSTVPRSVRIVGVPGGNSVEIEASHLVPMSSRERDLEVFRVDLTTGKRERLREETISGQLIYDQQGRPRLLHSEVKSTLRFLYSAGDTGKAAWKPLSDQLGGTTEFDLTANAFFRSRSFPLGFDADPEILYIASSFGRDTVGVYGLNLKTGRRTDAAIESAERDMVDPLLNYSESALVFDRFTRKLAGVRVRGVRATTAWVDAELASVQRQLEQKMPRHSLVVHDWDEKRERFLVLAFNRTDPGAFLIYSKSENDLRSYLPLAKGARAVRTSATTPWTRRLSDGRVLSGNLSLPSAPAMRPIPTVLYLPAEWSPAESGYSGEITALCQMGFAVLEVSTRGSVGRGLAHWLAGRDNLARVVAEDYLAALDALATEAELDRENVAAFGADFAGYLALRLAQQRPERIRAVVALDPVTNFASWVQTRSPSSPALELHYAKRRSFFGTDEKRLREQSPEAHPERLVQPLLLATLRSYATEGIEPRKLRSLLRSAGRPPQWFDQAAQRSVSTVRSDVFARIEEFLTAEFKVGAPRE